MVNIKDADNLQTRLSRGLGLIKERITKKLFEQFKQNFLKEDIVTITPVMMSGKRKALEVRITLPKEETVHGYTVLDRVKIFKDGDDLVAWYRPENGQWEPSEDIPEEEIKEVKKGK